jgi:hypothetical protein
VASYLTGANGQKGVAPFDMDQVTAVINKPKPTFS